MLALYQEKGPDFLDDLVGMFAFALYDERNDFYMVARDHIGIIPLYMGTEHRGSTSLGLLIQQCQRAFRSRCHRHSHPDAVAIHRSTVRVSVEKLIPILVTFLPSVRYGMAYPFSSIC